MDEKKLEEAAKKIANIKVKHLGVVERVLNKMTPFYTFENLFKLAICVGIMYVFTLFLDKLAKCCVVCERCFCGRRNVCDECGRRLKDEKIV
jgi:hypothetical protein